MTTTAGASKYFPKAQEGFTTTTSGLVASGASTVGLNSTGNYGNGDTVVLIIDPGVAGKEQSFTGVIDTSGVQATGVVWLSGTNVPHVSGATVVDYVAAGHIDLISAGALVSHNADGTPKAGVTYPTPILTTPTIADFTNAAHTHASTAQGGTLGATALSTSAIKLGAITDVTANQTITNGAGNTALTGFSLTVTVPAGGRDVQVFAVIPRLNNVGTAAFTAILWSGSVGGTQLQSYSGKLEDSADDAYVNFAFRHAPSAGSITYLVSVSASATNVTANFSSTQPGQMWANLA